MLERRGFEVLEARELVQEAGLVAARKPTFAVP
jgi:hypothetical protein